MTIWHKVKNNAASELASAISDTVTELILKTGEGSRFPAGFPYHITVDDEIMEVTAIMDDTMTVTRAQENTSPAAHNAGTGVRLNITAALIEELQTQIDTKQASLPLTTKGDLLGFAAALTRLPVGSNGQYLVADSVQSAGVKWQTLSGGAVIGSGAYTGNGVANRAISHGMGTNPKLVIIRCATDEENKEEYNGMIFAIGTTGYQSSNNGDVVNPTVMDGTNFYVIDDIYNYLNHSGDTYFWLAIG